MIPLVELFSSGRGSTVAARWLDLTHDCMEPDSLIDLDCLRLHCPESGVEDGAMHDFVHETVSLTYERSNGWTFFLVLVLACMISNQAYRDLLLEGMEQKQKDYLADHVHVLMARYVAGRTLDSDSPVLATTSSSRLTNDISARLAVPRSSPRYPSACNLIARVREILSVLI